MSSTDETTGTLLLGMSFTTSSSESEGLIEFTYNGQSVAVNTSTLHADTWQHIAVTVFSASIKQPSGCRSLSQRLTTEIRHTVQRCSRHSRTCSCWSYPCCRCQLVWGFSPDFFRILRLYTRSLSSAAVTQLAAECIPWVVFMFCRSALCPVNYNVATDVRQCVDGTAVTERYVWACNV